MQIKLMIIRYLYNISEKLYLKVSVFIHFFKQLYNYNVVELTTPSIYQCLFTKISAKFEYWIVNDSYFIVFYNKALLISELLLRN